MHLKALWLLSLAVFACGPSPPGERTLLLAVDGNVFFDGLRLYREDERLLYTFDESDEFELAATLIRRGRDALPALTRAAARIWIPATLVAGGRTAGRGEHPGP